jgi:hypothetical protein
VLLRDFLAVPAKGLSRELKTRQSNLVWILFLLVVLIAAYLRLASLNLAEFKSDEAGTSIVLKPSCNRQKSP